jgi:hypothetical protein
MDAESGGSGSGTATDWSGCGGKLTTVLRLLAAGRLRSYSNSLLSTKRLPYSVLRTDTADR